MTRKPGHYWVDEDGWRVAEWGRMIGGGLGWFFPGQEAYLSDEEFAELDIRVGPRIEPPEKARNG